MSSAAIYTNKCALRDRPRAHSRSDSRTRRVDELPALAASRRLSAACRRQELPFRRVANDRALRTRRDLAVFEKSPRRTLVQCQD